MRTLVPVFEAHRAFRLAPYTFLDVGGDRPWFDEAADRAALERAAARVHRPLCATLTRLAERHGERFGLGLTLSGTLLEQLEAWSPATLEAYRALVDTGRVELVAETSHRSLTERVDPTEFAGQVDGHRARLADLFGARATTCRVRGAGVPASGAGASRPRPGLDPGTVRAVGALGFRGLLDDAADRDPARVRTAGEGGRLRVLARHPALSDDLAFRLSDRARRLFPLSGARWAEAVHGGPDADAVLALVCDLDAFGGPSDGDAGGSSTPDADGCAFLEQAFEALLADGEVRLASPAAALAAATPEGPALAGDGADSAVGATPPADRTSDDRTSEDRPSDGGALDRGPFDDVPFGPDDPLPRAAHAALHRLGPRVRAAGATDPELLAAWRRLTTADHFHSMSTAGAPDGTPPGADRPFPTPHDAHIAFMNVLTDLKERLDAVEAALCVR